MVSPSKKLDDLIHLAELCVDLLQQNEEHYAEVSMFYFNLILQLYHFSVSFNGLKAARVFLLLGLYKCCFYLTCWCVFFFASVTLLVNL